MDLGEISTVQFHLMLKYYYFGFSYLANSAQKVSPMATFRAPIILN